MIDLLTRKLAPSVLSTYDVGIQPQFTNAMVTVHVFLSLVEGVHNFSFEGTTDEQEWIINFMAWRDPFPGRPYGGTHFGLTQSVFSVIDQIENYLASLNWPPYYFSGHSKGAGEAGIAHMEMKYRGHPPVASRLYEPPQVCIAAGRDYMSSEDTEWTCTRNAEGRDTITQLPLLPPWCHFRDPIFLTVPDSYDRARKHRMPAVSEAISLIP